MGPWPLRQRRDLHLGQSDWGFHTVRGGINPGDARFLRRVVGVVEIW